MQTEVAVLRKKINYFEHENVELKNQVKDLSKDVVSLITIRETMLIKLDQIQRQLADIQGTMNKDSGWRGFFLDFIKEAVQIAVLLGAGKWIF
ncbi:hypothetical protein [Peribacillus sp. V2I11]|uniref:hypothetical protein n=1 Tax=Peribacillus sp. V2I11 TaxID=3042277 RepID=UPI0027823570|nr:hypothetical protein [Peribacillus sp. V2I11]MDQ0880954.1 septal ring factor EnvC (AmiA/AmiB activator) [Peribacillus sp. V2I11]